MKKILVLSMSALFASNAFGILIDFNDLTDNDILGNQYAGQGVIFSAGHTVAGIPNPTATSEGFATNTNLEVADLNAPVPDVGLGVESPMSGIVIHSFDGWLTEDGDATMTISFASAIGSVSLDFGGVSDLVDSALYAVDGNGNIVASASAGGQNTATVSLTGLDNLGVTTVVVGLGNWFDWVAVDNLNYTEAVPEPASMIVLGGLALAAAAKKRKK